LTAPSWQARHHRRADGASAARRPAAAAASDSLAAAKVEIRGGTVEVKIGVQFAPRELVLESAQTPTEVERAVADALASSDGVLSLVDEKGRRVIVPVGKLAYVEIAEQSPRAVGFTAG